MVWLKDGRLVALGILFISTLMGFWAQVESQGIEKERMQHKVEHDAGYKDGYENWPASKCPHLCKDRVKAKVWLVGWSRGQRNYWDWER